MKLAIIGAGSVGGTLGTAWAQKAGHEIFFGVRDPKSDKVRTLLRTRRQGAGRHASGSRGLRRYDRLGDAVERRRSGHPLHG